MVEIVSYDERWPEEFMLIATALRDVLDDQALRIDHIGSTSVPGLPAKDIIDIQVTVASLEPDDRLVAALAGIGYTLRSEVTSDHQPPGAPGDAVDWAKRFFRPPVGQRRTNLHVRVAERANQRYALLFRDYLRAHPTAAAAYAEVKRCLAHYHPDDLEAYVTIKDPVCDIIMSAAEEWVASGGWRLGPSDA